VIWLIVIWGALIPVWVVSERWTLGGKLKRRGRVHRVPVRVDPAHPFDWMED
jgi:hypothetical protein